MSVLPVWIPAWIRPQQNTLREPAQGRVILRWNRLGKINRSMKKNPASHAPRARTTQNASSTIHKRLKIAVLRFRALEYVQTKLSDE